MVSTVLLVHRCFNIRQPWHGVASSLFRKCANKMPSGGLKPPVIAGRHKRCSHRRKALRRTQCGCVLFQPEVPARRLLLLYGGGEWWYEVETDHERFFQLVRLSAVFFRKTGKSAGSPFGREHTGSYDAGPSGRAEEFSSVLNGNRRNDGDVIATPSIDRFVDLRHSKVRRSRRA